MLRHSGESPTAFGWMARIKPPPPSLVICLPRLRQGNQDIIPSTFRRISSPSPAQMSLRTCSTGQHRGRSKHIGREEPGEVGHQKSRFTHPFWRALIIKISGSRKYCFVVRSLRYRQSPFGRATIVCSICFMKNQNVFEKGEMGQTGEKWDKA